LETNTVAPPAKRSGRKTVMAQVVRVVALAGAALTAVQFALAGLGAFGLLHHEHEPFAAHEALGTVIGVASLVLLIVVLAAGVGTRAVVMALVLAVLAAPVQPVLANLGKNGSPWLGALHALSGVAIMALFGLVGTAARSGAAKKAQPRVTGE
jgi:hypothetical protein